MLLGLVEYNYRSKAELIEAGLAYAVSGETWGLSVFLRDGDRVFHSYSTYGRGAEAVLGIYSYLDSPRASTPSCFGYCSTRSTP